MDNNQVNNYDNNSNRNNGGPHHDGVAMAGITTITAKTPKNRVLSS